jgi:CHAT domain-containing protein
MSGCRKHLRPDIEYQKAEAEFESGDLQRALNDARSGAKEFRSHPDWDAKFTLLSAEVLIWQGQYKDSLALLDQAAPVPAELVVRQKTLQSLADTYLQRFDPADRLCSEAEQLATARAPERLADVYLSRGLLNFAKGNYSQAEGYYLRMLPLARARKRDFLVIAALGNLGVVNVKLRHYDKAVDLFSALLETAQKRHNPMQLSKASGNLGWCYLKLGNYEKALELYTQAESLASQKGSLKDQRSWLEAIGSVHLAQHDVAGAEPFFEKALTIARQLGDKSSIAIILTDLAVVELEQGRLDDAERNNHESLQLEIEAHDRMWFNTSRLTEAHIQRAQGNFAGAEKLLREVMQDSREDASLRWESEATLGELYAAQKHDSAAEAQFRRALATVDAARAALTSEEFRLTFLTTASEFYDSYIEFLVEHGRARDALEVAEHSRARTLGEGLGIKIDKASFQPEQAALRAHGTLLAYWLKPGQSYLWVVTSRQVRVVKLPPAEQIRAAVRDYNKALSGPRDVLETQNETGQQLYSMLVAPAEKQIVPGSRVVLVPDDILHTLNFETLLAPRPRLHYWIEDVVLTNAPALAFISSSAERKPANKNLLLIGSPLAANPDFPPLPQAKLEMQAIQKQFVPSQSTVLEGGEATARAYLSSNTGSYSFIHFVTHGTASRVAPLESSIVLSPDRNDYKLYARDITSHPLHAELVTISACYGAGTRAYTGEGLVGLSWAFLRAGAHNVVAALWEVNDASTPQLMDGMYKKILGGASPAEALRLAKLEMLHSHGVFRRPFYWGAFQCYTGY